MNFDLSDEQQAVRDVAAQVFAGSATLERVKAIEAGEERVDRELWRALGAANLLGIALPEDVGGSGLGLVEACLVLEQQGRAVAPVPYWTSVVCAALPLATFGTEEQRARWLGDLVRGETFLTAALAETGPNDPFAPEVRATRDGDRWRLDGQKISVPAAHVASAFLVPAATEDGLGVFVVDRAGDGLAVEAAVTTDRSIVGHLTFVGSPAELLGGPGAGSDVLEFVHDRALVGLCALQVGICEEAVRMAAAYTSAREQFGRPLSTFQGAQLKAADGYIGTEAMRVTMLQAAWKLDVGRDATTDATVAKWWAAEAGQQIVHITQHLHGGLGADVDYPIHRYFLWGKQIEDTLGGASAQLARLGRSLAEVSA